MKQHPNVSTADILSALRDVRGTVEHRINPMGERQEVSPQEAAEMKAKLAEIAVTGSIVLHCIACDDTMKLEEAACCECGGFVCPICRALETEGECHHEPPAFLPIDDDDEEADE